MREYTIKGIKHLVFEDDSEVPQTIQLAQDWRKAQVGEWVRADDGHIIQILRAGSMLSQGRYSTSYVGTCTGTFICSDKSKMDTNKRKNIYSFGGDKTQYESVRDRENLTAQEAIFAKYIARQIPPEEAYQKAFGTKEKKYAKIRAGVLMKTERVVKAVSEELDDVFEELGVDLRYLVGSAKNVVDDEENRTSDKLSALKMLWDAKGVVKKEKQTQITGAVFQGFKDKELQNVQVRELGAGNKEEK